MPTAREVIEQLPSQFRPEVARGLNAVIQFNFAGEGGGLYHAVIRDGTLEMREGRHESPNMTMTMNASDYVDLATGKLNRQMAFMSGKIKLAGDVSLAIKMPSLLQLG